MDIAAPYDASRHARAGRGHVYDSILDTIGNTPLVRLPRLTAALHLVGDGVAVPVVRYLAEQVLEPLLAATGADHASMKTERTAAA